MAFGFTMNPDDFLGFRFMRREKTSRENGQEKRKKMKNEEKIFFWAFIQKSYGVVSFREGDLRVLVGSESFRTRFFWVF